jgi:hypothetical protein
MIDVNEWDLKMEKGGARRKERTEVAEKHAADVSRPSWPPWMKRYITNK